MTLIYIPVETAIIPGTGYAWANRWWLHYPGKGIAFHVREKLLLDDVSPQCNPSEDVILSMINKWHPECTALLLPVVFEANAVDELHRFRDRIRILSVLSKD